MYVRNRRRAILSIAASAAVMLGAAACGSSDSGSSSSSSSASSSGGAATTQASTQKVIKVGLVTDIGGLNDRSFNALANAGLERAKKELGIEGRVLTSSKNSDYVPNLSTLAQQRYDLVIGVGFLMAESMETVADKFPNTKFAIIDSAQADMKSAPKNVDGLLFKEQQAGYLAGYLAGLYAKDNKISTVSSVGGQKIPPVDHYIAGYEAGAKAADKSIKTIHGYSQDFVDQAKCKEIGLDQISRGSGVVFAAAGQCGLGALDAAKQESKQGVGVDADQGYLGSYIMTSAMKRVDNAVFDTIKAAQDGTFKGGTDTVFDVNSGGVGLGKISATGQKYQDQITQVTDQIKAGKVNIPDTVSGT